MSGPKHLWSGDWERESAESQRRRARPETAVEPTASPFAPPPERARALTRRRRQRLGAAVAALVVGAAGVAYATAAIVGSHSKTPSTVGEGATAPLTVPTPTHTFSIPTTPTPTPTPTLPTAPTTPTTPTTATHTTPAAAGSAQPVKWLGMEIVAGVAGQAVVDTVNSSDAGGRAGLDPGDVIQSVAGHSVAGPQAIAPALTGLHAGQMVPIEVVRGSTFLTLQVTLGPPAAPLPVSFAAPLVLIALLVIPGLLAWYLVQQRRRRRAAAAFAAPALAASVTPRRPGRRRHVPTLLLVLALAALIVAGARPQRGVTVPVRGAAFLLANDVSNSMTATDVRPTRLRAAQAAASRFVSQLPGSALVGQMAFARHPELLQSPTTDHALDQAAIRSLAPGGGGTAIGATITTAVKILSGLRTDGDRRTPGAIVLLSDGGSNVGPSPVLAARRAKTAHIPIDTIALGTSHGTFTEHRHGRTVTGRVPVSTRALGAIAAASGGRAYTAADAAGAKAIYTRLAATLGHRRAKRDLDVVFTGGALALMIAAGGLSLIWFHRLI